MLFDIIRCCKYESVNRKQLKNSVLIFLSFPLLLFGSPY